MNSSRKIVCAGAGIIGRSWAMAFARFGYNVFLYDISSQAIDFAEQAITEALSDLEGGGLVESSSEVKSRIRFSMDLPSVIEGAFYLQESLPEQLEIKRNFYLELDGVVDAETICGSSVSGLSASAFMGGLRMSPRCIVVHPTNPPHLVPLTELFATEWTSPDTISTCRELMKSIRQKPVVVKKEVPGYVLNRIQAAVFGESLHLVGEGVISPEDLEQVMQYGLGPRWAIMGPFMTAHLNAQGGYTDYMTKYGDSFRGYIADLKVNYDWQSETIEQIHSVLVKKCSTNEIIDGQHERDRNLMQFRQRLEAG